jgi:hypothetical protein
LSTHERKSGQHIRLSLRGGFVFETFHDIRQGVVYAIKKVKVELKEYHLLTSVDWHEAAQSPKPQARAIIFG